MPPASMEATLTEIAELYKEVAPWVTLTFTFDSSGTLKTQIEEGRGLRPLTPRRRSR